MGVWDRLVNIGSKAQEVTQEQAKRTQLKLKRRTVAGQRKEAFQTIGEALYPRLREGSLISELAMVQSAVDRVTELDEELERLDAEEAELRTAKDEATDEMETEASDVVEDVQAELSSTIDEGAEALDADGAPATDAIEGDSRPA